MFEDKSHEEEIHGDGNHINRDRREGLLDSEIDKDIEQSHLQEIVGQVSQPESNALAHRGFRPECEIGREEEIAHKTHHIAYGKG